VENEVSDRKKGGEVVPFGKYKGQPVEVMMADASYCESALAKAWLPKRPGAVCVCYTAVRALADRLRPA
jgi:hypothetical protein